MSSFSLNRSNSSIAREAAEAALRFHLEQIGHVLIGDTVPLLPRGYLAKSERAYLSARDRLTHLYAIGATGSGKTNLLMNLLRSDVGAGRAVCVVDLRGDLVDRVLLLLAATVPPPELAERLVLIDLRDDAAVTPLNPLAGPGDPYGRALHVLSALEREAESWGVQLKETLRSALIVLAETGGSLLDVETLLTNPAYCRQVLGGVADPFVKEFFRKFWELSAAKQQEWRLPVLNKVTPLLSVPRLRRMFGLCDTLPLADLFNSDGGSIVLVALAADRLYGAAEIAGGMVVSALQSAIMARVDTPEAGRRPVMLYVDEFQNMATDRFEQIVAEGRRFGVGLTLAHQNLSQLPSSLRDTVRNNVGTQLLFQTGAVDAGELAREIVCGHRREDLREAITLQPVGEAFLVRRGQNARRIRIPRYTDPRVSPGAVKAARAAGIARFGLRSSVVDEELAGRLERNACAAHAPRPSNRPEFEVRNARSNAFDL